jgi:hypothetical protein
MGHLINEYNRERILQMIADVKEIESSCIPEVDWLISRTACTATEKEMYADYIKTLNVWYFFLKSAILEEDYEIAEEIRKILIIEEFNFHKIIYTYCSWYSRKKDKALIRDITFEFREVYNILNVKS